MLLMTFATKVPASVLDGVTRVATRAVSGIVSAVQAVINRREIMRLAELDDRALKDLGLMRLDVEGALASSWLKDPSAVLAARSNAAAEVASARREEGQRQAQPVAQVAATPRERVPAPSLSQNTVACSA